MKKLIIYINLVIIVLGFLFCPISFSSEILDNTVVSSELLENGVDDLTVYSDCILMIEKETGDILYQRNAYEKMYPASTTKMLTALLVLENCDLDEIATVSSLALNTVPPTYTTSNIRIGEKLRVEDLLYAMLIPSANDAANVLAEHVSGSIAGFAELMNKKAEEIGCTSSHFTNPSGVHDENLYTTAHDLALIARYAMNFEIFRKIVTTTTYTLPSTEAYPKSDRVFNISNSLVKPTDKNYYYEYATGVKTGYTNASKDCLVAAAKKDDVEFIIVVLGAGYLENGLRQKYLDCKTLFNFAFDNYTTHYQELQAISKRYSEAISASAEIAENTAQDVSSSNVMSKIIWTIVILLVLRFLFKKRKIKRRKGIKRNYYKNKRIYR